MTISTPAIVHRRENLPDLPGQQDECTSSQNRDASVPMSDQVLQSLDPGLFLPNDITRHVLSTLLSTEDLVAVSEASMTGISELARAVLVEEIDEWRRIASVHSVVQESFLQMNEEGVWTGIGQSVLQFRLRLGGELRFLARQEGLESLCALYDRIENRSKFKCLVRQEIASQFWKWPTTFRANREIVIAALQIAGGALQFASAEFRADRELVLIAVRQHGEALCWADRVLQADEEIVLAAVRQNGRALLYSVWELKNDRDIVLAAVQQDGMALQYASLRMKADREIVLTAVQEDGYALQYAATAFHSDRDLASVVVQQSRGWGLWQLDQQLRDDRDIVLDAVRLSGPALQFASERLRSDREIVLVAVRENGRALQHAGERLRSDQEIVLAAVKQNPSALDIASQELWFNREIIEAAGRPWSLSLRLLSWSRWCWFRCLYFRRPPN